MTMKSGVWAVCFAMLMGAAGLAHQSNEMQSEMPGSLADKPGNHGMFMVGHDTVFLLHMPMFTNEKHMYQVVLQAALPPEILKQYQTLRRSNPDKPYNLINVDDDKFTLPSVKSGAVTSFTATMFDGYSNEGEGGPGPVLFDNFEVKITNVVLFRHFNFSIPRPGKLTYTLFGNGQEAHLTHYIARDPDFQNILTLSGPPSWLSGAQVRAGVELTFPDLPSLPVPCSGPLAFKDHKVLFQGNTKVERQLDMTKDSHMIWFSAGNLLNKTDPCQ